MEEQKAQGDGRSSLEKGSWEDEQSQWEVGRSHPGGGGCRIMVGAMPQSCEDVGSSGTQHKGGGVEDQRYGVRCTGRDGGLWGSTSCEAVHHGSTMAQYKSQQCSDDSCSTATAHAYTCGVTDGPTAITYTHYNCPPACFSRTQEAAAQTPLEQDGDRRY